MLRLHEIIAWARWYANPGTPGPTPIGLQRLALCILANFDDAPALPCGHTVEACRDAEGSYLRIDGDTMDLESAHGFALAILRKIDERRAADEAEENQP